METNVSLEAVRERERERERESYSLEEKKNSFIKHLSINRSLKEIGNIRTDRTYILFGI